MKSRLSGIACFVILITILIMSRGQAAAVTSTTSIEKILSATESYDGKEVSVSGKVSNLRLKTSKRGNVYTPLSSWGVTGRDRSTSTPGGTPR